MPRRTNDFQQLVAMLAELLGEGAVVEESRMLTDLDGETEREVDVVVEGTFAGQHTLIGIECRDHGRKQDVTFVESMYGKHTRLPTDILILASSSGFTKLALAKAKMFNIRAITPAQVTDQFANAIAIELSAKFKIDVRRPSSSFTATRPLPWKGRNLRAVDELAGRDYQFLRADGSAVATAHEYEALVLSNAAGASQELSPDGAITIRVQNPELEGARLHARFVPVGGDEKPALLPLDVFTVVLKLSQSHSFDMSLDSRGMFGDIPFYTGTSTTAIQGRPARFVVADPPSGRVVQVTFDLDVR